MDFRVYVTIEMPILDKKYEMFIPIDRRIHDLIGILKKSIPELKEGYYKKHEPNLYSKTTGEVYDMNLIIKNSNIKMGTRLLLI
ncbi:MAG: hypothetical protein IKR57_03630 [Bacilli bacterium]|nr:hypothetical protein [Bacilli bacterium]